VFKNIERNICRL